MYNYIPMLLVGAGRLIINGINKRNQAADKAMAEDSKRSASAASSDPRRTQETELYRSNASHTAIGLVAKLAKADGVVSKEEVRAVESIFADLGAVGELRQQAIGIFQTAKDGPLPYIDVLDIFERQTPIGDVLWHDLILMLLRVAHANGRVLSYQSEHLIQTACSAGGLDYQEHLNAFQTWRQASESAGQASADQLKLAYETLGCEPADSSDHIRHRYRQLVRDFHPDTIAGKGLSPEFTRFAEEKFKQIQAAFELLTAQRR